MGKARFVGSYGTSDNIMFDLRREDAKTNFNRVFSIN